MTFHPRKTASPGSWGKEPWRGMTYKARAAESKSKFTPYGITFLLLSGAFWGLPGLSFAEEPPYGRLFSDGPKDRPLFALTFDDGPGPSTERILALLARYGAKATFFMSGEAVALRPQRAGAVLKEGHLIGNHTYRHVNFHSYRENDFKEALRREIKNAAQAIEKATGYRPILLRMPHGYSRLPVQEAALEEKCVLINWTAGYDWKPLSEDEMLQGYLKHLRPGAILLLHDRGKNRERTLRLTEKILEEARKRNLKPVRVDELLGLPKF